MRSLKRLITALLAFVMILTCVGITTFAADFSDITDQKVAEAVDKLVGFNIITGYEDGTFRPDNQITRAEFAAIVTRYKGIADNLASDAVTGFSDLDADSSRAWARPYVKAAVDAKIINGFDDGTFRAGEPVTYEQAVKMLVCAAGYEVVAQSELNKIKITNPNATWSAGYIAAAVKHGITKNAYTAQVTQPASRGVVAVLTSNTIDVPELKENEDGTFEKVEEGETDQTVEEIKGIVSATYYTAIDAASADISQKEIEIRADGNDTVYELTDTALNSVDMEKLVGKRVTAYYDKHDRVVTSIKDSSTVDFVIDESDVISASADSVKYYTDENRRKTNSVSLSGYTIIYNGKYGEGNKLATDFTNGTIEIVEAQKMAYVTSYKVGVVSGYTKESNTQNGKITFKYVTGADATYDVPASTSSKPTVYINGTKTEFNSMNLSPYDVINHLESSDKKINKMYVTKGVKTGKVTAGLNEDRVVELNNTEFTLTQQYADYTPSGSSEEKAPFELGETYYYYLDYTGQIAAVKYDSNTQGTYKYGYLTAVGEDRKNNNYVVKIASVDEGKVVDYTLNSSVKVDGVPVKDSGVENALTIAAAAISNKYKPQTIAQPIRYEVSGTTVVKSIDTLTSGEGGTSDNFTRNIEGGTASTVSTGSIKQGSVSLSVLSSTTKILYVPDDVSEDSSYAKLATDAFKQTVTRVEAFNAGSDKIAPFVIVYGANNPTHVFTANSPYMIVTRTSHSGDSMTIRGYKNGGADPDAFITVNSEYYKGSIDKAISDYSKIAKGDLIRYIQNGSNVVAIERVYDAGDPDDLEATKNSIIVQKRKYNVSDSSNSRYYRYGMVFAASAPEDTSKRVALSKYIPTDADDAEEKASAINATYFNCQSTKFYELDSNGNVNKLDSFPVINGYNQETNTADIAIIITPYDTSESEASVVYIINN